MNCITGQFHITYTDTGVTRQVELLLKGLGREMIATMILCVLLLLLLLLLLLFTAIGFSPGGSSPYTSTHNTNGNMHCSVLLSIKKTTFVSDSSNRSFGTVFTVRWIRTMPYQDVLLSRRREHSWKYMMCWNWIVHYYYIVFQMDGKKKFILIKLHPELWNCVMGWTWIILTQ
jgi:hypothetical protein